MALFILVENSLKKKTTNQREKIKDVHMRQCYAIRNVLQRF